MPDFNVGSMSMEDQVIFLLAHPQSPKFIKDKIKKGFYIKLPEIFGKYIATHPGTVWTPELVVKEAKETSDPRVITALEIAGIGDEEMMEMARKVLANEGTAAPAHKSEPLPFWKRINPRRRA